MLNRFKWSNHQRQKLFSTEKERENEGQLVATNKERKEVGEEGEEGEENKAGYTATQSRTVGQEQ